MDIEWLEKFSFYETEGHIIKEIERVGSSHYESGWAWIGAIVDLYSDLCSESRSYFSKYIDVYAKEHKNFKLSFFKECINEKIKQYPILPSDIKKASNIINKELVNNLQFLCGYYGVVNEISSDDIISINDFYFEVRWILGQIINSYPDILDAADLDNYELPQKYIDLDNVYHIVEFILKTLSDRHTTDFFTSYHPKAFIALLREMLSA